ncbi:MAG: hypothetical protein ACUVTZ_11460 [Armatimonadota bacterium]
MASYGKIAFVLLAAAVVLCALPASSETVTLTVVTAWDNGGVVRELPAQLILTIERIFGDADGDGVVTTSDVLFVFELFTLKRSISSPSVLKTCDVRPRPGVDGREFGDGQIRADDVRWVLECVLGGPAQP